MLLQNLVLACLFLSSSIFAARIRSRDGRQAYFRCTEGNTISIDTAYYGSINAPASRACEDVNAKTILEGLVSDKTTYLLAVSDAVFTTSSCAANAKEALLVTYTCVSNTQSVSGSNAGTTIALTCTDGKTLKITRAEYADDARTCYDPNALSQASTLCDGKESCSVLVDDTVFTSSTCTTEVESLIISYICQKASGKVYTHWGSGSCGANTKTILSGKMASGADGSGSDYLCLASPYVASGGDTSENSERGKLVGVCLYNPSAGYPFSVANHQQLILCSVCQTLTSNGIVVLPGKSTCPSGFSTEYQGYMVSEGNNDKGAKDIVCLDQTLTTESVGSQDAYVYPVQVNCGAISCSDYVDKMELKCVVCSR